MGRFYSLEDFIKLSHKSSHEIILELLVKLDDFSKFLKFNITSDWIRPTITILSKVCLSSFAQTKFAILQVAVNPTFLETLKNYVKNLNDEKWQNHAKNEYYWINKVEFVVNLVFVYKSIVDIFPINFEEILQTLNDVELIVLRIIIVQKIDSKVSQKVKANIKILRSKLGLRKSQLQPEEQEIDNFRTLSVYPTNKEILSSNILFNTEDITNGKYENVEQYLKMQFRILKNSFVEPLRQEMAKFIKHKQSGRRLSKSSFIRIYPDAIFQSMVLERDKRGAILIFFNQDTVNQIFSLHSNCIDLGVLLCFTKDNFSSVLIGRVIEKNYENQYLIIDFDHKMGCFEFNVSYTVLEYNVVFQKTYFALKALQCMSEDNFPMESYLIDVVLQVKQPNYLDPNSPVCYTIRGRKVNVFGYNWPAASQLDLDPTQYTAYKAALTQKFVMIQGAPGTGKTYLALKIVKTLLDNQNFWYKQTPILIVCLSNQVLDTFLEGLIPTTNRIIKVGETKSEKLVNYTLNNVKKKIFKNSYLIHSILNQKNCNNHLKHIENINNVIINVKFFENIDDNLKTSWLSRASIPDYLNWLFNKQDYDPDSIKFSELIKEITEENKRIASLSDSTAYDYNIYREPYKFVVFSKTACWSKIVQTLAIIQKVNTRTDNIKKEEKSLKLLWRNYQYFNKMMRDREFSPTPTKPINVNYQSPQSMNPQDRWDLYLYWLNLYKLYAEKQFHEFRTDTENILDLEIMKRQLILGMTVNTAAEMRATLQALNCRIVVVQEASDVSEAHIVLSLTKNCDHLILMGNQQVTKSLTSVYDSYRLFDEGPTMMKRMMHFKVRCHTLGFQHRMRPKIFQLVLPFFQPKLNIHHSVIKFSANLKMPFCLFFVNHNKHNNMINLYEAIFLIDLACYLKQVGYAPEDITILALNSRQMQVLCDQRKIYGKLLQGIKICVVENYKGEESKVILLSLVRNNQEEIFVDLKSEKFINLVLSRAKEVLYMIGNINLLCQNSKVWQKIRTILIGRSRIANYLPVYCKTNPNHVIKVNEPEDFYLKRNCNHLCGYLLNCRRSCCKKCHIMDNHGSSNYVKINTSIQTFN